MLFRDGGVGTLELIEIRSVCMCKINPEKRSIKFCNFLLDLQHSSVSDAWVMPHISKNMLHNFRKSNST